MGRARPGSLSAHATDSDLIWPDAGFASPLAPSSEHACEQTAASSGSIRQRRSVSQAVHSSGSRSQPAPRVRRRCVIIPLVLFIAEEEQGVNEKFYFIDIILLSEIYCLCPTSRRRWRAKYWAGRRAGRPAQRNRGPPKGALRVAEPRAVFIDRTIPAIEFARDIASARAIVRGGKGSTLRGLAAQSARRGRVRILRCVLAMT